MKAAFPKDVARASAELLDNLALLRLTSFKDSPKLLPPTAAATTLALLC